MSALIYDEMSKLPGKVRLNLLESLILAYILPERADKK
jgi:hypothetical protein